MALAAAILEPLDAAWLVLRWPLGLALLWWALVWWAVARLYLRSTLRQWRAVAPDYRGGSVRLWLHGVGMMMLGGLYKLRRNEFTKPFHPDETLHPVSITLQHGIVCAALCSGVWGLMLAGANRSHFSGWQFALNALIVTVSTVGGMIHLYPPLRANHIVKWRCMMLGTWAIPLATYTAAVLYLAS